jgi:hypothetical protein
MEKAREKNNNVSFPCALRLWLSSRSGLEQSLVAGLFGRLASCGPLPSSLPLIGGRRPWFGVTICPAKREADAAQQGRHGGIAEANDGGVNGRH